jgi:hypothetical protein
MTRLFRRLRIRFLFNKKFSKYLLYAIGEVLILIFGILIALQVNNWNEERKREAMETVLLRAIKTDLNQDLINCRGDMKNHILPINSSNIILTHFNNDLPLTDSLYGHFLETCSYTTTTYNTASFETLKSLGVGLISNEDLRNEIIFMYDGRQHFLTQNRTFFRDNITDAKRNLFSTRFEEGYNYNSWDLGDNLEVDLATVDLGTLIPLNYESLKKDTEYIYFLKTTRNYHENYLDLLKDFERRLIRLISNIETEISLLEG